MAHGETRAWLVILAAMAALVAAPRVYDRVMDHPNMGDCEKIMVHVLGQTDAGAYAGDACHQLRIEGTVR